jgi:hypothetical protein
MLHARATPCMGRSAQFVTCLFIGCSTCSYIEAHEAGHHPAHLINQLLLLILQHGELANERKVHST